MTTQGLTRDGGAVLLRPLVVGKGDELAESDLDLLERWENDSSIAHLHRVLSGPEDLAAPVDRSAVRRRVMDLRWGRRTYVIELQGRAVGVVSLMLDPEMLARPVRGTLWPGVVIGEAEARGRGIGRLVMQWIETIGRELGCGRIELGVFEHNTVARRLYEGLGYREHARVPGFTWWDARRWDDIRMEKELTDGP